MQNHFAPKGLLKDGQERFRYIDMAYFMGMILVVWGILILWTAVGGIPGMPR